MTASGKSRLSFEIARERGDVDLVSVDSMAVYRGMDIATAKAPGWQREIVPHHLVDVLDPHEEATVSWFQGLALDALKNVETRNRHALLVGGTGLYHRAVIDRLEIPGQYPQIREELDTQTEKNLSRHYEQLRELDPVAASRIEASNARRVVRALEVTLGSGRPFSSYGPGLEVYPESDVVQIGLDRSLEEIDMSIEQRVTSWSSQGIDQEIDALLALESGLSRTASQAIGYAQFIAWRRGARSLDEAEQATIVATRQFARRQRSWFRRDPRVEWFSDELCAKSRIQEVLNNV